jgi:hypothetical protein
MNIMHATHSLFPTRRAQRGQTLIVAIAILFVLLFIGGVFVAQVGRNLTVSGRSRQIQQATELAEAGIRYCQDQLVSSEEGADWRPEPSAPITSALDTQGLRDPDYFWLSKGFHRMTMKGGRALVRVVYDPHPADPRGHLLKIESVGRPGELNPDDPTEFSAVGNSSRLRKEMIGYVQIGLTDYGRFVTNRTKNGGENVIGVPTMNVPLALVLGDPEIGNTPSGVRNNNIIFGFPMRIQGNALLMGDVRAYLSNRGVGNELATERIEVTGEVRTAPTRDVNGDGAVDANTDLQQFINPRINLNPDPNPATTQNAILPTGQNFTTRGGKIRDGSANTDNLGHIRNMANIAAPLIDTPVGGGDVSRYRAMTANSGILGGAGSNSYNTGRGGYGEGIYINNPEDRQEESSDVANSLSLRAEWLNLKGPFATGHWQGPFYRPPGIQVELRGNMIRLTRNDNRLFTLPDGTPLTQQGGKVLDIPLSDWDRQNYRLPNGTAFPLPPFPHDGDEPDPNNPFGDNNSYGVNVVIFAEGNVRVKGFYGMVTNPSETSESTTTRKLGRVHLTIVSGGTAYIDGNIVKADGFVNGSNITLERGSTCALMARDYVCVNTTAFMAPTNQNQVWNRFSPDTDFFYTEVGMRGLSYDMVSSFGIDPGNYNVPPHLFLRQASMGTNPALLNLMINPAFAPNPTDPFYLFNDGGLGAGGYPHVRALGIKYNGTAFVGDPTSVAPQFEQRAYPLVGVNTGNYQLSRLPGLDNLFRFRTDQTSSAQLSSAFQNIGTGGTSDYALGGAFVAPLDIRIEAMLYAQDRSFFVIPGYPMNPDPDDTRENVATRDQRKSTPQDSAQDVESKRLYPFYNEPADIRITVEGAISENYTASLADQTQWMNRWGWIPTTFGSSTQQVPGIHLTVKDPASINPAQDPAADYRTPQETAAGITRGMRFLYDPSLAMPYYNPRDFGLSGDANRTLRQTRALRAKVVQINGQPVRQVLPPIPRLPVCPELLYMGDSDRRLGTD